ncbi:leucine rich repeat domain-containing protein [Sodiomyces alkalinus F11]|uniref:Leucine rich repeat domain-containing protein n=1 Tax=Sodiomyces alkalinus (strain CBS 110278 / VKM F-3762 / F11) TaxID=1314773 RepID=A0A3N2Q189_SODAK|nr:leucine rich repeat domain-containing protein [Sodiomyces alkalinus F11]ROT40385.1 leucine rich repeat domain-containing protein [Sodiomyces alkalinus F11]
MDSEDGELFVKQLASFVRTHEKALANALQFRRQSISRHGPSQSAGAVVVPQYPTLPERPSTSASTSSGLIAALSFGSLSFTSQSLRSTTLSLTPHHLFYLLSRFEELAIPVGPMKIRLENLHDTSTSANYVSFLGNTQRSKSRGSDVVSIHSVSSVRSVMSGMSAFWAGLGIGASISAARTERQKAQVLADLKYLYSAFTKIPCLKLSPDWRARLIRGYEEFPFDSAVPLYIFKNVQALEVNSIDFRQFFGWDRLAEQLRSLTLKRAGVDDPADILIDIVLDDMDKRRKRTSKSQSSPTTPRPTNASPRRDSMVVPHTDAQRATSCPGSPNAQGADDIPVGSATPSDHAPDFPSVMGRRASMVRADPDELRSPIRSSRPRSNSPTRPLASRSTSTNVRGGHKFQRSGSGSSHSSLSDSLYHSRPLSSSNLLTMRTLPASKWRFLKHLSLADNSMTSIPASSLAPLAETLQSLDLSTNLFDQIPDSLATLTALRSLNLSNCMIESLNSLTRNPLPAITAINLRGNRLQSIAGIEKLFPLERLDLRDNRITDPMELARLTGIPELREIWVEGNPFCRTHRDYRTTIFNLFRKTPGYTVDIIIDKTGPSHAERRYLVERVPIPAAVPVVKPASDTVPAVDVSKPAIIYDAPRESSVLRKERPSPRAVTSEVHTSSTRRRKPQKRRIVDLATPEAIPPASTGAPAAVTPPKPKNSSAAVINGFTTPSKDSSGYQFSQPPKDQLLPPAVLSETRRTTSQPEVPRIDTSIIPTIPPMYASGTSMDWKDSQDWDISGEMYRRKIEALRDQVGNGYLSVLSEESWETSRLPNYTAPTMNAPPPPIHSGRTLGNSCT